MGQTPLRLKVIPKIQSKFYTLQVIGSLFSTKKISDFEAKFSKKIGINHCIATFSGRSALIAILKAMKLKKGDEIIMPGFTFFGLAHIVSDMGFTPVFADVDKKTLNINPDNIEELITKRTAVLLIVHNLGNPNEMEKIVKICSRNKLKLIEDCAHTIGSKYNGRNLGTFGDASIFSFHYSKIMNTFWGGIAATNDKRLSVEIKKEIKKFKKQGNSQLISRIFISFAQSFVTTPFVYTFIFSPINSIYKKICKEDIVETLFKLKPMDISSHEFRFTNFQARIGLMELKNVDEYNRIRKEYLEIFRNKIYQNICTQEKIKNTEFVPLQLVIFSKNKEKIISLLRKQKIEAKEFYISNIPKIPAFSKCKNNCSSVEKIENEIIYFPTFHYQKKEDIEYIAENINLFYNIPE